MDDSARSGVTPVTSGDGPEAVGHVVEALARYGLTVPAIVLLELLRPVGFLCGQALWVLEPVLNPITGGAHRRLARFFEDGGHIDRLLSALEER